MEERQDQVEYTIGTDGYEGEMEFEDGSLRLFFQGGDVYYELHENIVSRLEDYRIPYDDVEYIILKRKNSEYYVDKDDFFDRFSHLFIWTGLEPKITVVGKGFTMQPVDTETGFHASFEDKSRYEGLSDWYREHETDYRCPVKPSIRVTNGLYPDDSDLRHSWFDPYQDEPDIDEIRRRVAIAWERMIDKPSRIYMLNDDNVHDLIFMLEGRTSIYPPDNRDFQPLFGRQVHVFFMKDVLDCGTKDYVCVYERS